MWKWMLGDLVLVDLDFFLIIIFFFHREFFQSRLKTYAEQHPHVEVAVKRVDRRHPTLTAHYSMLACFSLFLIGFELDSHGLSLISCLLSVLSLSSLCPRCVLCLALSRLLSFHSSLFV